MTPLLINTTISGGGAAKACLRLWEGLRRLDIESQLLVTKADFFSKQPGVHTFPAEASSHLSLKSWWQEKRSGALQKRIRQQDQQQAFMQSRSGGLDIFSYPDSRYDLTAHSSYAKADLINLHWVSNFLDYPSFFRKNTKPIVWTLHDMNPFSGGEHYEEWYLGMDEKGKPIPRDKFTVSEEREHKKVLDIKKEALVHANDLCIVAPSNWLTEQSAQSELFSQFQHYCIPYGLDTDTFQPRNRRFARELLGIPEDKKVLLFVATSLTFNRKGYAYLQRALEHVSQTYPDTLLCALGVVREKSGKANILELGFLSDELLLSVAYSAADAFVIPSLMDNLPNTVLESLCCGTPVIGFPVGGIPEMVQHGKNGYLTEEISVDALVATLEKFLSTPEAFDRQQIRNEAAAKYALEVQAKAYRKLFREIPP